MTVNSCPPKVRAFEAHRDLLAEVVLSDWIRHGTYRVNSVPF